MRGWGPGKMANPEVLNCYRQDADKHAGNHWRTRDDEKAVEELMTK